MAVGNPDMMAAVRVNAFTVRTKDGYTMDIHIVASQEADAVIRGIYNRNVTNIDGLTALNGNRFWAPAFPTIPIDPPRADNGNVSNIFTPDQAVVKIGCFAIRIRFIVKIFVRVKIGFIRARANCGSRVQVKCDGVSEVDAPGNVCPPWKINCAAARFRALVNSLLDGAGILGLGVPAGAVFDNVK